MESVELLKALAEPTRLRVVHLLVKRGPEICVCDITDVLEQPQSTVSRQLALLRQQDVVNARREGLWMHYSLAKASTPLHDGILAILATSELLEPKLAEDLKRFDRLKRKGDLACCAPQSPNAQKCCAPTTTREKANA